MCCIYVVLMKATHNVMEGDTAKYKASMDKSAVIVKQLKPWSPGWPCPPLP